MVVRRKRKYRKRLGTKPGRGARKRRRGAGNRGGRGRAGLGKRAAHKKTYFLKYEPQALGKKGFKSIKQKKELGKVVTLTQLQKLAERLGKNELDLREFGVQKVISGEITIPLKIKVEKITENARRKLEAVGGAVVD